MFTLHNLTNMKLNLEVKWRKCTHQNVNEHQPSQNSQSLEYIRPDDSFESTLEQQVTSSVWQGLNRIMASSI